MGKNNSKDEPIFFRYKFTSTAKDMLKADEAERSSKSMRPSLRWLLAGGGVAWIAIGIAAFDSNNPSWQPLIWVLAGTALVFLFAIKPAMERAQLKKANSSDQDVTITFSEEGLRLRADGGSDFTRSWEELLKFTDTKKGILFYFTNGAVNWLPERVFKSDKEKTKFIEFLKSRQSPKQS